MAFAGLEGPFSEDHALVMLCRLVDEELKPNFYILSCDFGSFCFGLLNIMHLSSASPRGGDPGLIWGLC